MGFDEIGATGTVTFSSPMPSINYVLEIFNNNNAGAISYTKTLTGFTYTILSVLGGTGFSYEAALKQ